MSVELRNFRIEIVDSLCEKLNKLGKNPKALVCDWDVYNEIRNNIFGSKSLINNTMRNMKVITPYGPLDLVIIPDVDMSVIDDGTYHNMKSMVK